MEKDRKHLIFGAIVEHFIKTAQPVGSKTILLSYKFDVSPATVRNDMATLEEEGLIFQPHTSAGRVPTDLGYRLYADELADYETAHRLAEQTLQQILQANREADAKEKVWKAVRILSQATPNMAFATVPGSDQALFMGFSKMLRQPEFLESPMKASQVMEVIEEQKPFLKGLQTLGLTRSEPKILIGEENILPDIDSCSLIVARYEIQNIPGFIGILGPKRMPYAYNTALLLQVRDLLESDNI